MIHLLADGAVIREWEHPLRPLMMTAVKVGIVILALTTLYVFAIRPVLRILRRAHLNERERQLEHQKHLRYKYNNRYNVGNTKAGLEKQEIVEE